MSQIPYLGKLCSAIGCTNRQNLENTEKGLSFHRFPMTKPDMLEQWLANVNRPDLEPSRFCILCSIHFEPDCFVDGKPTTDGTVRRRLRHGSVPTLNMGWPCSADSITALTSESTENFSVSISLVGSTIMSKCIWSNEKASIVEKIVIIVILTFTAFFNVVNGKTSNWFDGQYLALQLM